MPPDDDLSYVVTIYEEQHEFVIKNSDFDKK